MRRRHIVIRRVKINAVIDQNWLLPHLKNLFINNQLVILEKILYNLMSFFASILQKPLKTLQKILCFFMLNIP